MVGPISGDKFSTQQYANSNSKSASDNTQKSINTTKNSNDSYSLSSATQSLESAPPQNGLPISSPEAARSLVQQLTANIANNAEQAAAAFSNLSSATVEASLG